MIRTSSWVASLFLIFSFANQAWSQTFSSVQDGPWETPATWGLGSFTSGPPSASNSTSITINNIVTINSSISIDQTTISSGATLNVAFGQTLTVSNGTGNDLTNDGTFVLLDDADFEGSHLDVSTGAYFRNTGTLTFLAGLSSYTFQASSTYEHARNGGVIPTATWNSTSTVYVTGVVGTNPTGFNQTLGTLVWECASQTGTRSLAITGTRTYQNLEIRNTGASSANGLAFSSSAGAVFTIAQNFTVSNAARFAITGSTSTVTFNVNGNYSNTSTNTTASQLASSGTAIFNVRGTFSQTGDNSLSAGSTTCSIRFTGTTAQTFVSVPVFGAGANFQVNNSAIVDFGTNALVTDGNFTVQPSGTIRLGATDSDGAFGPAGNIQVAGTIDMQGGSTVIYNGAGAQYIGSDFPFTNSNVTVSNNNTLNLNGDLTIGVGRTLTVSTGSTMTLGSNNLTINGSLAGTGALVVVSTSTLTIGGSGALGTLSTSGSLGNLSLNRPSGSITLGSALTMAAGGTLTQTDGDISIGANTLTIGGNYSRTAGAFISTSSSSIIVNGSGTLPASVGFQSGSALNTFTMSRSATSFTTSAALTITNLNLTAGTLNNTGTITMASAGTITRTSGTISSTPAATTSYNVTYENSGNISSGAELPSVTTALNDLTKNGSGTLTLASDIRVNGTLRFNDGIFDASTRAIDIMGNFITVGTSVLTSADIEFAGTTTLTGAPGTPTFGNFTITGSLTPNTTYQINGNLTNSGTLNAGNGTVTFGGTSTISGAGTTNFNNVVIAASSTLNASTGTTGIAGNFVVTGTFNHNNGTISFNGTTASMTSGLTFNNLTIANSSSLNGPFNINVIGNWTNNGTFNRGTGTVTFAGTAAQLIQGSAMTEFNNITITNATSPLSVQVATNTDLHGVLTLSTNTIFDPDGSGGSTVFRLRSTGDSPTVDASIATIPTGAQITGSITAQRYMSIESGPSGNNRIYRNISSPVTGATAAQIKAYIPISGTFTGANHTGSQSMFEYTESVITDTNSSGTADLNDGYIDFPNTADTETLSPAKGYNIFIRGNETPISTAGNALFEVRGTPNVGPIGTPINFNTTFTSSGTVANDGWNLVGNPFPATIDWNSTNGWSKGANVTATIYVRDNGGNPARFAVWNGVTGTNGGSRYIPMGQAFWVKTDGAAASLTADERVKVGGTQSTFFREGEPDNLLRVTLKQGQIEDETVIHFRENATGHFDSFADAIKMKNSSGITATSTPMFNLATLDADLKAMAINSLAPISCGTTVNLALTEVVAGNYALNFSEIQSFSDEIEIELHDAFTNQTLDIRSTSAYQFQVTSDAASYGSSRFSITFSRVAPVASTLNLPAAICAGENYSFQVEESNNAMFYSVMNGTNEIVAPVQGNGNTLVINIPKSSLTAGSNLFTVKSQHVECEQLVLSQNVNFNVESLSAITATNASRCGEGEISLQATGGVEGNYRWYESETSTTALATSSSTFTVSLNKSKTYFVSALNSLGCESQRKPVKAEILFAESISTVSSTPACEGASSTLTASGALAGSSYRWYESASTSNSIPGASGATFKTPELFAPKTYFVSVVNSAGCESGRMAVEVLVAAREEVSIDVEGNTLISSAQSGNQWYRDGQLISGATQQTLEATTDGIYTLEVSNGPCKSTAELEFIFTGIEESGSAVSIYPNPTDGEVAVNMNSANLLNVQVFNPQGMKIMAREIKDGDKISLLGLTRGVYYVYLRDGKKVYRKKIVKK